MCAADGRSPLQRLVVSGATVVQRPGIEELEGTPYSGYDAIRAQLAASRARSYQQGWNGCCSKTWSYLDSTIARNDEVTRDQEEDA